MELLLVDIKVRAFHAGDHRPFLEQHAAVLSLGALAFGNSGLYMLATRPIGRHHAGPVTAGLNDAVKSYKFETWPRSSVG